MATRTGPAKRKNRQADPPFADHTEPDHPEPLKVPVAIVQHAAITDPEYPPTRVGRALELLSQMSSYRAAWVLRSELGIGRRAAATALAKAAALVLPKTPEAVDRYRGAFIARFERIAERAAAVGDFRAACAALDRAARLVGLEPHGKDATRFGGSLSPVIDITALGSQTKGQDLTKPLSKTELAELAEIGRELGPVSMSEAPE